MGVFLDLKLKTKDVKFSGTVCLMYDSLELINVHWPTFSVTKGVKGVLNQ